MCITVFLPLLGTTDEQIYLVVMLKPFFTVVFYQGLNN